MKEKGRRWLKDKGWEKWFQRDNLIILVLSGILLFIVALPTGDKNEMKLGTDTEGAVEDGKQEGELFADLDFTGISDGKLDGRQSERPMSDPLMEAGYEGGGVDRYGEYDYAAYLEERLAETLGGVSGVGQVTVMITLKSSEELIVEKDEPVISSEITETDSQGGERSTSQLETRETTIYNTAGTDSIPYVVMRMLPKVEGVLVVAEGAGIGRVNESITEMVLALFDVEVHKVKVVKMKESQ